MGFTSDYLQALNQKQDSWHLDSFAWAPDEKEGMAWHKPVLQSLAIVCKLFLSSRSQMNSCVAIKKKKLNTFILERWSLYPKSLQGNFCQIAEYESKAWFKETSWPSAQRMMNIFCLGQEGKHELDWFALFSWDKVGVRALEIPFWRVWIQIFVSSWYMHVKRGKMLVLFNYVCYSAIWTEYIFLIKF